MRAHWLITKDFTEQSVLPQFDRLSGRVRGLEGLRKTVEIWGPKDSVKPELQNLPLDFIIADDDGNVYYRGVADERAEFQPLDMFGEPHAGATMIAYKRGGKWNVL